MPIWPQFPDPRTIESVHFSITTPQGSGAIGIISLAGKGLPGMLEKIFKPRFNSDYQQGRMLMGDFLSPDGNALDEVILDIRQWHDGCYAVDINTHGGQVSERLAGVLEDSGACRLSQTTWADTAEGGLLDQQIIRAYGRARTQKALEFVSCQASGVLRESLEALANSMTADNKDLDRLLSTWQTGRLMMDGIRIMSTGLPNAGKSTLFNTWCGSDRALVAKEPGTTRDVLEAEASCCEWPCMLVDGAGIREGADEIESSGVALARSQIALADVVILVKDAGRPWTAEDTRLWQDLDHTPRILVMNKMDINKARPCALNHARTVQMSALKAQGFDDLQEAVFEVLKLKKTDLFNGPALVSDMLYQKLCEVKALLAHKNTQQAAIILESIL